MSIRASTIFAVIIAVVLGLGAAITAKAAGLFSSKETAKKETAAPLVLVTAKNVFEGEYLESVDVRLRPAKSQAEAESIAKGELLPPVVQAAAKRMARVNIPADMPIKREYLEELAAPSSLKDRLSPGMRAVSVGAMKIHSAGGLIQVGDWVDVYLTSTIDLPCSPDCNAPTTLTAMLACKVRVIAKRNSLWPVPNQAGSICPMHYVLEANPYRAALIEFAKEKGVISLMPVSLDEKQELEARRTERMNRKGDVLLASYSIPDCPEYADEDKRINAAAGCCTSQISEADLLRIFNLRIPEPPPAPAPLPPSIHVNKVLGAGNVRTMTYEPVLPAGYGQAAGYGPTVGGYNQLYHTQPGVLVGTNAMRFSMPAGACANPTSPLMKKA